MAFKPRYRKKKMMKSNRLVRVGRKVSLYPNAVYTASENVTLSGAISIPSGGNTASGTFSVNMNMLPQITSYADLFRQFCIKRVTYTVVPRYGGADINAQLYNQANSTPNGSKFRFLYSVIDTPFVGAPGSEADMLQNNNVKIRYLNNNIIKIRQYNPKPDITVTSGSVQVNSTSVAPQWFNLTGGQTTNGGQNVNHGNVQFYITTPGSFPNGIIVADVYAKITFSLRNPD